MNFKKAYTQAMDQKVPDAAAQTRLQAALVSGAHPKRSGVRRFQVAISAVAIVLVAALGLSLWQPWNRLGQAARIVASADTTPRLQDGGADYQNVYAVFERARQAQVAAQRRQNAGDILSFLTGGFLKHGIESLPTAGSAASSTNSGSDSRELGGVAPTQKNEATSDSATGQSTSETAPDYSTTNIQVAGVDEGDIVKTDGRYIYVLGDGSVRIIRADAGISTVIATIPVFAVGTDSTSVSPYELYIADGRMVVIGSTYDDRYFPTTPGESATEENIKSTQDAGPLYKEGDGIAPQNDTTSTAPEKIAFPRQAEVTTALIYDVSVPDAPRLLKTISQSGAEVSSRMVGDNLYLVTNENFWQASSQTINKDKPGNYVPFTVVDNSSSALRPSELRIYPESDETAYTTVLHITLGAEPALKQRLAVLGSGTQLYMSTKNLYVLGADYLQQGATYTDATKITRVGLSGDAMSASYAARVSGTVKNQFSVDEKDGVLRVLTTVHQNGARTLTTSQQKNALYCLDSSLQVIGSITGIAPGEQVYSCRYIGNYAYFVTFRQVDPLFSADLSDPRNPKLVGALKIPGFSEYLHPWSDTELFGLGNDADETTGRSGSLKLSMFDTSDPKNVTVKHSLFIDDKSWSEASDNHHAILVDAQRGLIAFPADSSYLIYRYSEQAGFEKVAEIAVATDNVHATGPADTTVDTRTLRGLFIGQVFYVTSDKAIASFRMPEFTTIESKYLDD